MIGGRNFLKVGVPSIQPLPSGLASLDGTDPSSRTTASPNLTPGATWCPHQAGTTNKHPIEGSLKDMQKLEYNE